MARQTLTKTTPLGNRPSLPITADAADLAMTQADTVNKEEFVASGKDLVIAHNTGVGAGTVTITSVADAGKRSGDMSGVLFMAGPGRKTKLDLRFDRILVLRDFCFLGHIADGSADIRYFEGIQEFIHVRFC